MELLSNIAAWCGPNPAAVLELLMVRESDVEEIGEPEDYVITDVTLKAGKEWNRWYFTPESCSFKEDDDVGDHGHRYPYRLELRIPAERSAIHDQVMRAKDGRFILLFMDQHGVYRILGAIGNPARCSVSSEVEGKGSGRNGYTIVFAGVAGKKQYFYDGTPTISTLPSLVLSPGGGMVISEEGFSVVDGELIAPDGFSIESGSLIME